MNNYEKIYDIYDSIIKDYCKNIIIKNNIISIDDIFYLYIYSYLNSVFSINTKNGFKIKETDNKKEIYDDDGKNLSDYMDYDDNYIDKLGIYLVNGNGVCRHISNALKDILKALHEIDPNTYNFNTYVGYETIYENNINKKHMTCYVEYKNKYILQLDPYKQTFDYINVSENIDIDITNFRDNKVYDKFEDELNNFRLKHIDDYELISEVLHKKFDLKLKTKIERILFSDINFNKKQKH